MKKVVFLIRNVAPEAFGGGETYQIELGKILKKEGFYPIIFTASKKLLKVAQENGIMAVEAPYNNRQDWSGVKNLLLPIYMIWQIRLNRFYCKQIRKYKPIVINIQSRDEWIAATRVGKKMGVKVLWTDHIDFRTWVLTNVDKFGKNLIGKKILKLARIPEKIIMISDFEAKSFRKQVLPRKYNNLEVIKNGAIDCHDKRKNKVELNSFCYVGRLVDYKGIGELIGAFKKVVEGNKNVVLNIFGEGPDSEKYKKMAEGEEQIRFLGYTNEPLKAISENDVFVLPSYYEGLSLSLLDAAMLGKKIIATNVDGNPEVVIDRETGLLVPARDAGALARAMNEMIENKSLAERMSKAAREKFEREFDFEKTVREKIIPLLD